MNIQRIILGSVLILATSAGFAQKQQPAKNVSTTKAPAKAKYGALAVDRDNGFYYGWSFDQATLSEAENRAVEECRRKGGNCTVVLSYEGTGCAAYRTIDGKVGTAFGWGLAATKEEADAIAMKECLKRSSGAPAQNFVWSCNSANGTPLKEIYNAIDEIEAPVKVGNQIWSNKNLDVATFSNGDPIPEAKTPAEWQQFCKNHKPAFIYLNFDAKNGKKYGKLYNFHAVMDPRGLAPKGWHIPSAQEYETLIAVLGGKYEAGKKIRGKTGWDLPDKKYGEYAGNGTNESGLNFLPGGRARSNEYEKEPSAASVFNYYGDGQWWTSTIDGVGLYNPNNGYGYYNNGFAFGFSSYKKNVTGLGSEAPERGFSVRVIKN
ncbi:FISUMP domain-containing protein [Pedobacter sp.]|uniref:FISUMP domain-containing protein n=1 Tax=Pedobacter sp. TaxID=1411316 RepID=UPI00396C3DF4